VKKKKYVWDKSELGIQPPPKTLRMRNRILSYERVSSESQYTSGLGLENQTRGLARAAERLSQQEGGTIGDLYSDPAISAFSIPFDKRPAGKRLLEDLQPGDDVLIYRLDRGWRNTLDAIKTIDLITSKGAFVHFVCEGIRTDSNGGKEWINLLASVAQLESQMKSTRILEAMARCRELGRPTALPRFGTRAVEARGHGHKKLTICKAQALEAAQIWLLVNEYGLKPGQVENMIVAIRARKLGKPANLDMIKRTPINRKLKQIEAFISMAGPSQWRKWLDLGRESLKEPFEPCHLRLMRGWKWINHSDAARSPQLICG
jgi:DNA invertase Pin-like site-specific DNA recombinase